MPISAVINNISNSSNKSSSIDFLPNNNDAKLEPSFFLDLNKRSLRDCGFSILVDFSFLKKLNNVSHYND
jgi:hypothetical protein